ncbi:MAG: Alpha/beta hydrolase [Candidatus Tokpelaia hoelldobleri]|uniref:Alpha/beta hydrolase n=1 Tax=Candidatus Tokpelaia hoelldobleri TaxID=1902579 RepID=A0A1U9JVF2_9HYPH|nr:MAG: Alpha/beta hydrolase [Candidatus Tokpelaia hoelldoblerii]
MDKTDSSRTDIVRHNRFRYQIDNPAEPDGTIVILLHGSGGNETTLLPFARPVWPHSVLIGIRGRLVQAGETRWYRKITPTLFDQSDIAHESQAFFAFLNALADEQGYDLSRATFVGYSNGANLLAVVMMQHPDLVRRAILMRSMPVLNRMPAGNLHGIKVLTISGKRDTLYSPYAQELSSLLQERGATIESHMTDGNHLTGDEDQTIIRRWLAAQNPDKFTSVRKKQR